MNKRKIPMLVLTMFVGVGVISPEAAHAQTSGGANFVDRRNPDNPLSGGCIDGTNPLCVATNSGPYVAVSTASYTAGNNARAGAAGIAVGDQANANSAGSGAAIAIGTGAQAIANSATAIGTVALAQGNTSIAVGRQSAAIGDFSMALGNVADARGKSAIALGHSAFAQGDRSIAIGGANPTTSDGVSSGASYDAASQTRASGTQSVAIGAGAQTNGDNQVAIGSGSIGANNNTSTPAFGATAAPAGGAVSFGAVGKERQLKNVAAGVDGTDAVNVSQLKSVHDNLTTSVNNVAQSVTNLSTTVSGQIANATKDAVQYDSGTHDSVTFGGAGATSQVMLHNVASGTADTDAVNVKQLSGSIDNAVAPINQNVAQLQASLGATNQTVNNLGASVTNINSTLSTATSNIGALQQDALQWSTSLGAYDASHGSGSAQKISNVAAGSITAGSTDAVNGGQLSGVKSDLEQQITNVSNETGEAVKNVVKYDVDANGNRLNSVSFAGGNAASPVVLKNIADGVQNTDAVNVEQLKAVQSNIDQLGAMAVSYDDSSKGIITLGGTGGTKITNVRAGTVSSTSTDAVNGSQLYATNQQVAKNTADIASVQQNVTNVAAGKAGLVQQANSGPITVGADTEGTAVSISGKSGNRVLQGVAAGIAGTDAVNVDQLNAVLGGIQANRAVIKAAADQSASWVARADAGSIGDGASASGKNSIAVGEGSIADRDNSLSVGAKGNERQVTNVAAGTSATDAVNVQQLNDKVAAANGYIDQRVSQIYSDLNGVKRDMFAGVASAMAVAGLPQPSAPGRSMVSAATANYHGQQAFAAGYSRVTPNDKWVIKASVTANLRSGVGVVAGAGYQW